MRTLTYTLDHKDVVNLLALDPTLRPLFEKATPLTITLSHDPFSFMVFTVLGQQLSTKVADLLYARLQDAVAPTLTPKTLLTLSYDTLRSLGLSDAKAQTLLRVAQATEEGYLDSHHLSKPPHLVEAHLCQLKGIGPWSAEMFIMFVLDHMDVFSVRDLGLFKAYNQFFETSLTPSELTERATSWSPYRSLVAHALWHVWDSK